MSRINRFWIIPVRCTIISTLNISKNMSTEAQYFINLLSPYIFTYGYWVAFFGMMLENAGIPVPAETALIICSFFASQGVLKIWLVIPIAIIGDVIGDNIGFCIGRFGGRPLVEKYGRYVRFNKDKLEDMEALFRDKGGRTIFTTHFFATTRILAALTAGISHMHYPRFLVFNLAAAVAFISLVANITYFFGKSLDVTLRFFHLFRLAGLFIAVFLVVSFLYRFHQRKKHLYPKLGLKIIAIATATSILLGIAGYVISGSFIILPRTNRHAGLVHDSIQGIEFDVKQGFISSIDNNDLLITALGDPKIKFSESDQPTLINVTVRNINARDTIVQCSTMAQQPLVLDDLTLHFGIYVNPLHKTIVTFKPKTVSDSFEFIITADTHDAGPIFNQMIESINSKAPAFVVHAGDFVKHGKRRGYKAFLNQLSSLKVPFYSSIGHQELSGRGEPLGRKLFGPGNYSFNYQNSTFIILDTSKMSLNEQQMEWLTEELKKAKESQNIFLITYAAPSDDQKFTQLIARFKVKAVYTVKNVPSHHPSIGGVIYSFLEQNAERPFFYQIVHVKGDVIITETVPIIPVPLSLLDKLSLEFDKLESNIISYF